MDKIIDDLERGVLSFGGKSIRVLIDRGGNFWFKINDVQHVLGFKKNSKVLVNIEKTKPECEINTTKRTCETNARYISEPGLYEFISRSSKPQAKEFREWLFDDVLISIRKYGSYKLLEKQKKKTDYLFQKLNYLEKQNETLKQNLKRDLYPKGGIFYVLEYEHNNKKYYRIGITKDVNKRLRSYDTANINRPKVAYHIQYKCPTKLERCVQAMLHDYRYQNKKDFYLCKLETIKKAVKKCINSLSACENKPSRHTQPIENWIHNCEKYMNDTRQEYNRCLKVRRLMNA